MIGWSDGKIKQKNPLAEFNFLIFDDIFSKLIYTTSI